MPSASDSGATFPAMLWTHGGGFVFGNLELDDYWLRILCVDLQMMIVNVDYRLAPEHPFPTGVNDSYAALKWTVQNASRIKADLSKGFIVSGRSAGGNFAAVLAHRAKADPFFAPHPLTGQFLQIPATIHVAAVPDEYKDKHTSHIQNKDSPLLNLRHMQDYYEKYGGTPTDPDLSPFLQPSFEGLPPAYLQICGMDPLRDDGLLYAEKLESAGVPAKVDVYLGAPHAFELTFPQTKLAQKYDAESRAGVRWLLSGAPVGE
ncbi:Alpha/beta hydrolase fold-3 [Pilatotrama ljubarskyi]|nr:Alpha/beta hydrolase fold-3 [Pilatotrama ljubarskyi]